MKKIMLLPLLIVSILTYAQPKLIGTLGFGGTKDGGSVFRYDQPGTSPGIIHAFDNQAARYPSAGVCAGDGTWLYGVTKAGGSNNAGAFYRVQQNGTSFTTLYNLSIGWGMRAIPYYHTDGMVYFNDNNVIRKYNTVDGTTTSIAANGTIESRNLHIDLNQWIYFIEAGSNLVKMQTNGTLFTTLHAFVAATEGGNGAAGVTEIAGDTLFGVQTYLGVNNGGTIFSIKTDGTGFIVHHQFTAATGIYPDSKLFYFDGKLYGTTLAGGTYNQGVLFCIDNNGTNYRVLRHLGLGDGNMTEATSGNISISADGRIFGAFTNLLFTTNYYRLYKVDTSGANFEPFFTGINYNSSRIHGTNNLDVLLLNDQIFFPTGTMGRNDAGVLNVSDTISNGNDLYQFGYSQNGFKPLGGIIKASDGKLYGTTVIGGVSGNGVIYSMNADGTGYNRLHEFTDAQGYEPSGKLLEASDGKLYGACRNGGLNNSGTLYRINKDGSGFEIIYDYFTYTGAYSPVGGLVEDNAGVLYGVNFWPNGSLFKINKNGTGYTELKIFTSAEINFPYNGLTLQANYLYGACGYGGAANSGGLYRIKTDGTAYQVLHTFNGTNGTLPVGTPVIANNGKIYGTASSGGMNNNGVIYRLDTNGNNFSVLRHLSPPDGTDPWTAVIQAGDGLIYGGTQIGGTNGAGTLFRLSLDGTGFTLLKNFTISSEGQGVHSLIDLNIILVPLPLQFLTFSAQKRNENVLLSWKTLTETNTDRFQIERSTGTNAFTLIGTVAASGNSTTVQSYSFSDKQPLNGTNFYRLKVVDLDGSISFSKIVSVKFNRKNIINISPNPAKDVLKIQLQPEHIFETISVFDASGKLVLVKNVQSPNIALPVQHLSKGWYLLRLTTKNNKEKEESLFIKQ